MQIVKLSQTNDREAWLDGRRGVVTGTKAKDVAPPKRGTATPAGIYQLLAEKVAIEKDGEPERDRGLRLEDEALMLTQDAYNLDLDLDPGMWLSDDGKLGVSPDAAQVGDKPKYAAEGKCLDTKNHLQAIIQDIQARQKPEYNPIDSLKFGTHDYTAQAKQYFVINKDLETLYFTLYDDRVALPGAVHYVIVIERDHVEEHLESQEAYERGALALVDEMISMLRQLG